MKKICITTFFNSNNYGSRLQATALSRYFDSNGYDTYFLTSFKVLPYLIRHPSLLIARVVNKINDKRRVAFFNPKAYEISSARSQRLNKYSEENYKLMAIMTVKQWRKIIADKYTFVVGSDIVWQPANGIPAQFFLDFAYFTDLNKFSYASSLGSPKLPTKYYKYYRKYLGSFHKVSVREQSAADLLQSITGRDVEKVVDPTLLLTREEWSEFASHAEYSIKQDIRGYIVCYFVMEDSRYWSYVQKVQEKTGLQVIVLPMHQSDENQPYTIVLDGTPYEFVDLIKNATMIVTDSFHACMFSIIFNKEFYLLERSRKSENDKYTDFLVRYGLENNKVGDESFFERIDSIDYRSINAKLEVDRKESYRFIQEALT